MNQNSEQPIVCTRSLFHSAARSLVTASDTPAAPNSTAPYGSAVNAVNSTSHAAARSFIFWASERVRKMPTAVFPLTAYNALTGSNIYAGSLREHEPSRAVLLDMATSLIRIWEREIDLFSIQQLRWALTNINSVHHIPISQIINHERPLTTMKSTQTTLPPDIVAKLTMSLAQLEQALLEKDPMMPSHLRASHQLLISYPETVHLLDDDEIARLISAAQIHTGIEIVKLNTPKTAGRKKLSVDDL